MRCGRRERKSTALMRCFFSGIPRRRRFSSIRLNLVKQGGRLGRLRVRFQRNARARRTPDDLKRTYWFKGMYALAHAAGKNCLVCRLRALWRVLCRRLEPCRLFYAQNRRLPNRPVWIFSRGRGWR